MHCMIDQDIRRTKARSIVYTFLEAILEVSFIARMIVNCNENVLALKAIKIIIISMHDGVCRKRIARLIMGTHPVPRRT